MIDIKYLASVPHGRMTQMDPPVRLDVREFRVSDGYSAVLQVVSETSATQLEVNGQPAVYVDGSWTCYNCRVPVWQSGHRNQLIFERDGVVFWISGDQVEGVDRAMLIAAAAQLAPATISALPDSSVFTQRDGQPLDGRLVTDPAKGEVLALVRSGESPESGPAALYTSPSISQGGH